MRPLVVLTLICAAALAATATAPVATEPAQGSGSSLSVRVENIQDDLDSLVEEIDDLQEPVGEFDLFDECMYVIGVSEAGRRSGPFGYLFGPRGGRRRPALAIDIRGFGIPRFQFLAFPGEEPPSIECNEDAGQEEIDN